MAKMITNKRGRLSEKESVYIERHKAIKTPEQIAAYLRRPLSTIEKYIAEQSAGKIPEVQGITLRAQLENRPEWAQLKQQFTKDELEFFQYRYIQLMGQFGDSILPTEEIQVFQFITLEIFSNRVTREQRLIFLEQENVQNKLERLYDRANKDPDDKDLRGEIAALESKYADLANQHKMANQRHESYMMRLNKILESLKATRNQRLKVVEDSKTSFLGLLKLLGEEEFRNRVGREIEMMRLAAVKEKERLATPYKFADGVEDQPLLTPETIT